MRAPCNAPTLLNFTCLRIMFGWALCSIFGCIYNTEETPEQVLASERCSVFRQLGEWMEHESKRVCAHARHACNPTMHRMEDTYVHITSGIHALELPIFLRRSHVRMHHVYKHLLQRSNSCGITITNMACWALFTCMLGCNRVDACLHMFESHS